MQNMRRFLNLGRSFLPRARMTVTPRVWRTANRKYNVVLGAAALYSTASCDTSNLLKSLTELAPVIDADAMLKHFVEMMKKHEGDHVSKELLILLLQHAGVEDVEVAENIFHVMDWDGNGYLDQSEVAAVLTLFQVGDNNARYKFLFKVLDLDGSQTVDKDEFRRILTALLDAKYHLHGPSDPRQPAEYYSGFIEDEYHSLAKYRANRLVKNIFDFADKNRDGELSLKEFLHWANRGGPEVELIGDLLQQTLESK